MKAVTGITDRVEQVIHDVLPQRSRFIIVESGEAWTLMLRSFFLRQESSPASSSCFVPELDLVTLQTASDLPDIVEDVIHRAPVAVLWHVDVTPGEGRNANPWLPCIRRCRTMVPDCRQWVAGHWLSPCDRMLLTAAGAAGTLRHGEDLWPIRRLLLPGLA